MKISALIKKLEAAKTQVGDLEVLFSNDEEGNVLHDDCFLDMLDGAISVYPCGHRME